MDFQFSRGRKQNRKETRRRSLFRTPTKAAAAAAAAGGGEAQDSGTKRDALDAELMGECGGSRSPEQQPRAAKVARCEAVASVAGTVAPAVPPRMVDMDAEYRPLLNTERNLVDVMAAVGGGLLSLLRINCHIGNTALPDLVAAFMKQADQPEPLHALIPDDLPQTVRFRKLVEMAVDSVLRDVQGQIKPGQGCILDAVHRAAQKFTSRLDESICSPACSFGSGKHQQALASDALSRKLKRQIDALQNTLAVLEQEEQSWQRLAVGLANVTAKQPAKEGSELGDCDIRTCTIATEAELDGSVLVKPSGELTAQVERLPKATSAAIDRITLQVDTLRRALQHSQTVHDQCAASHKTAIGRIHAASFGPSADSKDARPLLRKLIGASGAGKENAAA